MKDTQPILIISTGRTGTIFLSRLFRDLYPDSASYHERGNSRLIQILTNLHFSHLFPIRGLKSAWKILKGDEIASCEKKFHIDANNFLYGLASLAPELYPNLKVLHIIRDPRTYVTSQLNFSRQKRTSFIGNYLIPFWQPNPFLVGEIPLYKSFGFTRFQKYCWIWNFKNRVMAQLESSNTSYLCIKFEDLFENKNPEIEFNKITGFFGLSKTENINQRFREPANSSKPTFFPNWEDWTTKQAKQLHELCGSQMKKYSYGNESAWLEKLQKRNEK